MKTVNNTQILGKSIDIQLKKLLQNDLKSFRSVQQNTAGSNQGAKKAA